jgi:hypothetical protein
MNPLFLLREGPLFPQKLELPLSNGESPMVKKYPKISFTRGVNISQCYTSSKLMAQGKYGFLQDNFEQHNNVMDSSSFLHTMILYL